MSKITSYKQGRTFPPTAQGSGLLLAFIGLIILIGFSQNLVLRFFPGMILFFIGIWIYFSRTEIKCDNQHPELIIKSYGFWNFKRHKKIFLREFDAGVIKKIRVKYLVKRAVDIYQPYYSVGYRESYIGLNLKYKGKYEFYTAFKGTEEEVFKFIQNHLLDSGLFFFRGAIKKGQEVKIIKR